MGPQHKKNEIKRGWLKTSVLHEVLGGLVAVGADGDFVGKLGRASTAADGVVEALEEGPDGDHVAHLHLEVLLVDEFLPGVALLACSVDGPADDLVGEVAAGDELRFRVVVLAVLGVGLDAFLSEPQHVPLDPQDERDEVVRDVRVDVLLEVAEELDGVDLVRARRVVAGRLVGRAQKVLEGLDGLLFGGGHGARRGPQRPELDADQRLPLAGLGLVVRAQVLPDRVADARRERHHRPRRPEGVVDRVVRAVDAHVELAVEFVQVVDRLDLDLADLLGEAAHEHGLGLGVDLERQPGNDDAVLVGRQGVRGARKRRRDAEGPPPEALGVVGDLHLVIHAELVGPALALVELQREGLVVRERGPPLEEALPLAVELFLGVVLLRQVLGGHGAVGPRVEDLVRPVVHVPEEHHDRRARRVRVEEEHEGEDDGRHAVGPAEEVLEALGARGVGGVVVVLVAARQEVDDAHVVVREAEDQEHDPERDARAELPPLVPPVPEVVVVQEEPQEVRQRVEDRQHDHERGPDHVERAPVQPAAVVRRQVVERRRDGADRDQD
mmetsp:Transcript_28834/g.88204  ORF Transcript_28834/g.88204 Transcript_28834/m.88204 type:complete len:554 (-) Transcript_28834:587-2248(-)